LGETREDTKLGRKVYDAVVGFNRSDDSHHVSSGVELVAGNIHASNIGIVVIEGNTAYHVEEAMRDGDALPDWSEAEAHMVDIVKRLGYKIVRSRNKQK
jgi:hypothetical protein